MPLHGWYDSFRPFQTGPSFCDIMFQLTPFYLEIRKRLMGKQFRPRSYATYGSYSAYLFFHQIYIFNNKSHTALNQRQRHCLFHMYFPVIIQTAKHKVKCGYANFRDFGAVPVVYKISFLYIFIRRNMASRCECKTQVRHNTCEIIFIKQPTKIH